MQGPKDKIVHYCRGLLSTTTLILLCLVLIVLSRLNYDVICVIKQHVRGKENSFSLIIEWSHLSGNPGPPVRYSDELWVSAGKSSGQVLRKKLYHASWLCMIMGTWSSTWTPPNTRHGTICTHVHMYTRTHVHTRQDITVMHWCIIMHNVSMCISIQQSKYIIDASLCCWPKILCVVHKRFTF